MEWINQNWMLIVFLVGMMLVMRRGGGCCGHAGKHHRGANAGPDHGDATVPPETRKAAIIPAMAPSGGTRPK